MSEQHLGLALIALLLVGIWLIGRHSEVGGDVAALILGAGLTLDFVFDLPFPGRWDTAGAVIIGIASVSLFRALRGRRSPVALTEQADQPDG